MPGLGSGAILQALQAHAEGNFEATLDPKGLKGEDLALALWLNEYAAKQRAADQSLQKTLNLPIGTTSLEHFCP